MTQATELIAKQMAAGASIGKIWGTLIFNVKDTAYGAKGDGITDDTAAIQAAINAASISGGTVVFPPGTYIVSALIKITSNGVFLVGSGPFASIISHTSLTGDLIKIGDVAGTTVKGCGITNLSIRHSGARTNGSSIAIENAQEIKIKDIEFQNAFIFVKIGSATDTSTVFIVVDDCIGNFVTQSGAIGISVLGGANGIHLLNLQLVGNNLGTSVRLVTSSFGMDTLVMDNCLFQRLQFGIVSNGTVGTIQNAFITNCIFDATPTYSLLLSPSGTSIVTRFSFVNCWFTSMNESAIILDSVVAGNVDGIYFSTCRWIATAKIGLSINSGNVINVGVDNCILSNCSTLGSGLYPAIGIAANARKFRITNSKIGAEGQTTAFQSYAISIGGNSDLYLITNNDLIGNVTGAIQDAGGTFTKKLITDNLGYNPTGLQIAPAVPASTVAQANNFSYPVEVFVGGGTVQGIAKNGSNVFVTSGHFILKPGETITLTYTVAPSWAWFGL